MQELRAILNQAPSYQNYTMVVVFPVGTKYTADLPSSIQALELLVQSQIACINLQSPQV